MFVELRCDAPAGCLQVCRRLQGPDRRETGGLNLTTAEETHSRLDVLILKFLLRAYSIYIVVYMNIYNLKYYEGLLFQELPAGGAFSK